MLKNERLLQRNSYPVGSPTPTQLTFGKTAEPTANGAKALLGKKDGAIAGTPAPATTRPNNGVEGEIIKNRTNAQTIPNQSIKEAETAKDLTADAPSELYKAHRKAQKAKETAKRQEPQATKQAETTAKETTQVEPNTNSRLEKIKKFIQGKTNKALDSDIKTYNELFL